MAPISCEQRVFGEHAVDHAAQRVLRGVGGMRPPGQSEKKVPATRSPALELGDTGADFGDFAGAVGQRDHREFRVAVDALDDALVAVIQRRRRARAPRSGRGRAWGPAGSR